MQSGQPLIWYHIIQKNTRTEVESFCAKKKKNIIRARTSLRLEDMTGFSGYWIVDIVSKVRCVRRRIH